MTEALEAAKRARDSGFDVRELRRLLKESRAAFESGNYQDAARIADRILEISAQMATRRSGGPARDALVARMKEARRATRKAKRGRFDVQQPEEALRQARAAYAAGDYKAAMEFADQAVQLTGSSSR